MRKQEFLEELREALQGEVSPQEVSGHISYYDAYIESEKQKGRSEEEVMEALGSPRLIAKTLIDAGSQYSNSAQTTYAEQESDYRQENQTRYRSTVKTGGLLWIVPIVILVILVLLVIFAFGLVIHFWPFFLVLFFLSFLFRRRR
jgi:uncharacterized membrane protein